MCNRTSYAQVYELLHSQYSDNREGTLALLITYLYFTRCSWNFLNTLLSILSHLQPFTLRSSLLMKFEHSFIPTHNQCVTVHRMPKFRSCCTACVVITGKEHCVSWSHTYISLIVLTTSWAVFVYLKSYSTILPFTHSSCINLRTLSLLKKFNTNVTYDYKYKNSTYQCSNELDSVFAGD